MLVCMIMERKVPLPRKKNWVLLFLRKVASYSRFYASRTSEFEKMKALIAPDKYDTEGSRKDASLLSVIKWEES